jgi:hypothetical protein
MVSFGSVNEVSIILVFIIFVNLFSDIATLKDVPLYLFYFFTLLLFLRNTNFFPFFLLADNKKMNKIKMGETEFKDTTEDLNLKLKYLKELIDESEYIVFYTGAGILFL